MVNFFKKNKKEPENLQEVLGFLRKLKEDQEKISRELAEFKEKSQKNLQRVGIIRFNPFGEVGGNQSFSIAVLDVNNNGFVITSHYGRESNRVYAKPVNQGESSYQLSDEEKKAIAEAITNFGKAKSQNPNSK